MKRNLIGLLAVVVIIVVAMVLVNPGSEENATKGVTKVKVAVVFPLTGPQAAIGRGCANSVQLAFDQASEDLRAGGLEVELVMLDDGSKPETAISAAQRTTSDNEIALAIAHFNSPCALATVDVFHEAGMPMITPAAVNSGVTAKGYQEIFRTCNTDIQQAAYMAKFLVETRQAERIYAIHDNSAFGKGLIGALEKNLAETGRSFSGKDGFMVGDIDYSAVVARVEAAAPDVIVLGCMAAEGALLRRQMAERNITIPTVGFSGIFYDTFLKNAGSAAEGTMAIFPLPPLEDLQGGKTFQNAYTAAGFDDPYESAGPFGYVAGQVAAAALTRGSISHAGLIQALHSGTFNTAFGPLTFADNGEMNLKMFCFYAVKNGRWEATHNVNDNGTIVPIEEP
ncbi:MAG: branched-chain amino acid ABC transporter substrate-binding protein [Candidatus Marinimicrobia bacterium]|nr:branched-chain amino acid ABC transporter substrate-binding protein [Candidatus Neomarinimicrobiota bacterium]